MKRTMKTTMKRTMIEDVLRLSEYLKRREVGDLYGDMIPDRRHIGKELMTTVLNRDLIRNSVGLTEAVRPEVKPAPQSFEDVFNEMMKS